MIAILTLQLRESYLPRATQQRSVYFKPWTSISASHCNVQSLARRVRDSVTMRYFEFIHLSGFFFIKASGYYVLELECLQPSKHVSKLVCLNFYGVARALKRKRCVPRMGVVSASHSEEDLETLASL